MRRHLVYYVCLSVAVALCIAAAVCLFVYDIAYAGALVVVGAVCFALALSILIAQDDLNRKCGKLCAEKRYAEERAILEKKLKSPLLFLVRTVVYQRYIRVTMALDDLPAAKRAIDSLRFRGGAEWKYKTAFFFILIKLDEGDKETAHAEYEEFTRMCSGAEIYREELDILRAVFRTLFTNSDEPLPQAAVQSPFPVLFRVLGKKYERGDEACN